jgi:hypothetical protein
MFEPALPGDRPCGSAAPARAVRLASPGGSDNFFEGLRLDQRRSLWPFPTSAGKAEPYRTGARRSRKDRARSRTGSALNLAR